MAKSGWCTAAPGARIPHEACRFALCSCDCHAETAKQIPEAEDV